MDVMTLDHNNEVVVVAQGAPVLSYAPELGGYRRYAQEHPRFCTRCTGFLGHTVACPTWDEPQEPDAFDVYLASLA